MIRIEFDTSKRWMIGVGVFFAVVFGFLMPLLSGHTKIHVPVPPEKIGYSYEMPRVETIEIPFDLSGRKVVRKYPEVPTAAPVAYKAPVIPAVGSGTTGKAFPKITKKEDPKKKKAKTPSVAKKKDHQVKVVTASDRFRMKPEPPKPPTNSSPPAPGFAYFAPTAPTAPDPIDDTKKDDDVLDPSTWQSLLQNQPSASNVAKFMKARLDGKVNDAAFFRIVVVLLQDHAEDRRKAGLQLLDQDTSPQTYEFLVLRTPTMPGDLQPRLQALTAKYTTPTKMFLLARVLASSSNKTVLLAALSQLSQVAASAGPSPVPGQPTNPSSATVLAQLNSMVSVLRKVSQNPDQAVAGQAKSLLSALQKS